MGRGQNFKAESLSFFNLFLFFLFFLRFKIQCERDESKSNSFFFFFFSSFYMEKISEQTFLVLLSSFQHTHQKWGVFLRGGNYFQLSTYALLLFIYHMNGYWFIQPHRNVSRILAGSFSRKNRKSSINHNRTTYTNIIYIVTYFHYCFFFSLILLL